MRFPISQVFESRQYLSYAGQTIPIAAPEQQFMMLLLHGSKHMWWRLIWLIDLVKLLEGPLRGQERIMMEHCRTSLLLRELQLALGLIKRVFDVDYLEAFGFQTQSPAGAIARLEDTIYFDFVRERSRSFALPVDVTAACALRDGVGGKLDYIIQRAVHLSIDDYAQVAIPDWAFGLYHPVRLARLTFRYSYKIAVAGLRLVDAVARRLFSRGPKEDRQWVTISVP